MAPLADATMGRWFTSAFDGAELFRQTFLAAPPEGYAACCDALRDWDFRDELGTIATPTLVLVGDEDPATPPDQAQAIADGIPGAQIEVIPGAAHLLNAEQPDLFNRAVHAHLEGRAHE